MDILFLIIISFLHNHFLQNSSHINQLFFLLSLFPNQYQRIFNQFLNFFISHSYLISFLYNFIYIIQYLFKEHSIRCFNLNEYDQNLKEYAMDQQYLGY